MILGLHWLHFCLLIVCTLMAGATGAGMVLTLEHKRKKRKNTRKATRIMRTTQASAWQNTARSEQIYSGR